MSIEENKAVVRRFIEAFNRRDHAGIGAVASPELAKDVVENWFPMNDAYWDDQRVEVTAAMANGDAVWARLANTRRHIGEYRGLPPTGKTLTTPGIMFARVVNGRIVETSFIWANMKEVEELGGKIVPAAQ